MRPLNILVTSGGCEESVDGVRSLCNFSTGATAVRICEALSARGHSLYLLKGKRALRPDCPVELREFSGYDDLERKLQDLQHKAFDCVIFNAAVSDYGVEWVEQGDLRYRPGDLNKFSSSGEEEVRILLKPHRKLIDRLQDWFGASCRVMGFKLTCGASAGERKDAVDALFGHAPAEVVLSNDLREIEGEEHGFMLWKRDGSLLTFGASKAELAGAVADWAEGRL